MDIETKRLIFFVRSYCVCTPQDFVTECFHIFIVDEVKNFAANNICSSCQSQSRTGIRAKGQLQIGSLCIKGNKATTRSSLIGYYSEDSIVDWYFEYVRVVGKIPYTYNCLIVDWWILGSGDLKITQQGFCLTRFSPFVNKSRCQIYFLCIFGDLLVPSQFACN